MVLMLILSRCRRSLFIVIAALLLAAASPPVQQADPARYLTDIKSLASPEMEGRGAGTKGLTRAERLIEKRYKELGGQVTVLVQEGVGHFPTAPKDIQPVVEFIARQQAANAAQPALAPDTG